jgi:hypothetical protein
MTSQPHELGQELDRFLGQVDSMQALLRAWEAQLDGGAVPLDPDDRRLLVDRLEPLFLKRILLTETFSIVARLDAARAVALLLRRYVGRGVSGDRKFGGYEFELSVLFNELVAVGGRELLRQLARDPAFDPEKLSDARVLRALEDALDLDDLDEVHEWLRAVRDHPG